MIEEDASADELKAALQAVTLKKLSELFTCIVGLAAYEHPEELRSALGTVFDLSSVEARISDLHGRVTTIAMQAEHLAYESAMNTNDVCREMHRTCDVVHVRQDQIGQRLERVERAITRLEGLLSGNRSGKS